MTQNWVIPPTHSPKSARVSRKQQCFPVVEMAPTLLTGTLIARNLGMRSQIMIPTWSLPLCAVVLLAGMAGIYLIANNDYQHEPRGYVSSQVCGRCHEAQYASWLTTRMAKSFDVLKPGHRVNNKASVGLDPLEDYTDHHECLPCHTTGYMAGGFVSITATPEYAGVGCEACHGPGGKYVEVKSSDGGFSATDAVAGGLIYPPTTAVCLGCHNENKPFVGHPFDYAEAVTRGTHEHPRLNRHN